MSGAMELSEQQLRDLYEEVGRVVAGLEEQLAERDERLARVEAALRMPSPGGPSTPSSHLSSPDTPPTLSPVSAARLSLLFQSVGLVASAPSPVAVSAVASSPPRLTSRLSASGTDFGTFGSGRRPLRDSHLAASVSSIESAISGAVGPIPKRESSAGSTAAGSLAGMGHRPIHHNELSALSLKARRLQKQPMTLSESLELEQHLPGSVSAPTSLSNAALEDESSGSELTSPVPSPLQSPLLGHPSQDRPRFKSSLHGVELPDQKEVRAALLERTGTVGELEKKSSGLRVDARGQGASGHIRSRSGGDRSSLIQRFKSAFPARTSSHSMTQDVAFEQSGPIAGAAAADGGFLAHSAAFGGRPLFGSSGGTYVIESYVGDGHWTWDPSAATAPPAFSTPLTDLATGGLPCKCWIYRRGPAVVFAQLEPDGEVIITTAWPRGTVRATARIANARLMSPDELVNAVLFVASPQIHPMDCERVRGRRLDHLKQDLRGLEELTVLQCVDVDVVELSSGLGVTSSGDRRTRRGSRSSKKGLPMSVLERLQVALTKKEELDAEWPLTYRWAGVDIRLHFCSSLTQARQSIAVCLLPDDSTMVSLPSSDKGSSTQVVIACRLQSDRERWELSCCRLRNLAQFGPPFFHNPVKEKRLQGVLSSKILHAAAAMHRSVQSSSRTVAEIRQDTLVSSIENCVKTTE